MCTNLNVKKKITFKNVSSFLAQKTRLEKEYAEDLTKMAEDQGYSLFELWQTLEGEHDPKILSKPSELFTALKGDRKKRIVKSISDLPF